MWILKLKSVDSEVKSVDPEAKKCGFMKKNSHFFYCLLPKVWFNEFDSSFEQIVLADMRTVSAIIFSVSRNKINIRCGEFMTSNSPTLIQIEAGKVIYWSDIKITFDEVDTKGPRWQSGNTLASHL